MEKPLKILTISTSDVSGGAARAAYRIMKGVQARGVQAQMLVKNKCTNDETVLPLTDFIPKNVFYKVGDWTARKIKNKTQHARWGRYPRREDVFMSDLRSTFLYGALQKMDYDVLHLHWFNLRFLNIRDLLKVKKPIVWTLHDSWAFTGICHYFYDCEKYKTSCGNCPFLHSHCEKDLSTEVWRKKKEVYEQLDFHIVTPSRWLAECAKESALLGKFPVSVIPNCLDTTVFKPAERKKRTEKRILYGAMNALKDSRKGFSELLAAIQYIEEKTDVSAFELVVFGTDKPIEAFDIKMNIRYLGYLTKDENLAAAYNDADVMVVPSLSEVFGQTASEAMACGTPVVAFDCTGIKEVVDHKQTGYLARAFSAEDLAEGILWCLENNGDGHLSENARRKVEENYTTDVVSKKYVELYESLKQ